MKKTNFYLFFALALITGIYSCSGDAKPGDTETEEYEPTMTAVEYNDFIVNHQNSIISEMMNWLRFEDDDLVGELEKVVEMTHAAVEEIKEKEPYPGGENLKKAALDLFMYYERTLGGAFMEVAEKFQAANGDIDMDTAMEIQTMIQEATADEAKYDAAFAAAQQSFASANNMDIRKNELQDQIDALGN
jgi:hypothetical protein